MITAEVVCDSISSANVRLITFVLTYPRFIHSEFMTHRMISRNASSSRAIPVKKVIEDIKNNPVIPLVFVKNQKGMQGGDPIEDQDRATELWLRGRDEAIKTAEALANIEIHKQYVNRVLEPYSHIKVIATATNWANFFALRYHKDAQPEIMELAKSMWKSLQKSTPKTVSDGGWHLPFIDEETEKETLSESIHEKVLPLLIKRSVAKCARVSYNNHDGSSSTLEQDIQLYDKLLGHTPIHASPAEHQGMAIPDRNVKSGNFQGWLQYRKTLPNENISKFLEPNEL